VYPNELESQPEFESFTEWLQTFELYRGKKSEDELEDENRVVGKFKVRTGKVKLRTDKVKVRTGKVKVRTGKVKVRTGKVKVRKGKVKVRTGKVW
jgi:nitrite reductase/ring-hydroxylating ferredoxin subunit